MFVSIEEDDSVQVLIGDEYIGEIGKDGRDGIDGKDGADGHTGLDLSGKPEKNTLISMIKSLFVKD